MRRNYLFDVIVWGWFIILAAVAILHFLWPLFVLDSLALVVVGTLLSLNFHGLAQTALDAERQPPRNWYERWNARMNASVDIEHWTVGTLRVMSLSFVALGLYGVGGMLSFIHNPFLEQVSLWILILTTAIIGVIIGVGIVVLPIYGKLRWARLKSQKRAPSEVFAGFDNPDALTRAQIALTAGDLGDPQTTEPLVRLLQDSDLNVRVSAALALVQLGDKRAMHKLLAEFENADEELREYVVGVLRAGGDACLPLLLQALHDEDQTARLASADLLGLIGNSRSVPILLTLLDDPEWTIRQQVGATLGKIGDARAIQPLIHLLDDTEGEVRAAAAWALADLHAVQAIPALQRLAERDVGVDSEGYPIGQTAVAAIQRIQESSLC